MAPIPFLERLRRCDYCHQRAIDPILRLVDLDEAELICEVHAAEQQTDFTPAAAIVQAQALIRLSTGCSARKAA